MYINTCDLTGDIVAPRRSDFVTLYIVVCDFVNIPCDFVTGCDFVVIAAILWL